MRRKRAGAQKHRETPDSFDSPEEAGRFWDEHSLGDFAGTNKNVKMTFDIVRRTRYISLPEAVYKKIDKKAKARKATVRSLIYAPAK